MNKIKKVNERKYLRILFLEAALVFLIFSFSFPLFLNNTNAGVGENVTVISNLTIGNSNPNIISINIEEDSVILTPNATTLVNCSVIIEDYDGDADITLVNATLFENTLSSKGGADDNNTHYTNSSCTRDATYGDSYQVKSDCFFYVEYYANPGSWNCTVFVQDASSYNDEDTNDTTVQDLLAIGLPTRIDYGTINATYVSDEQSANVSNVGNVLVNLSLNGYGLAEGDGHGMVCDFGATQNISVGFEKYNLTDSNSGEITYTQFENNYSNVTNAPFINDLGLGYRQNDAINDMINTTYWRVYVPAGVAGTCNGTVLFGAIESVAS